MSARTDVCSFFVSGGCSRGEWCPFSHDLTVHAPEGVDASGGFIIAANVVNPHLLSKQAAAAIVQPVPAAPKDAPTAYTGPAWAGPPLSSRHRMNVNAREFTPPMAAAAAAAAPSPYGQAAAAPSKLSAAAPKWQASNLFALARLSPPPEELGLYAADERRSLYAGLDDPSALLGGWPPGSAVDGYFSSAGGYGGQAMYAGGGGGDAAFGFERRRMQAMRAPLSMTSGKAGATR